MRLRARTLVLFAPALFAVMSMRHASPVVRATPDGQGALSGIYDLVVHDNSETTGFYHCMVRLDEDSGTHEVASAAQCYADIAVGDPNAEPAVRPGEGPDLLPGAPPPLPYNPAPPVTGDGQYVPSNPSDPDSDTLMSHTCFPNIGGLLGPNAVATIEVHRAAEQLADTGKMYGELALYRRQGILQCDTASPDGASDQLQPVTLHPAADMNGAGPNDPASWRTLGDADFDDDGCSDADELLLGAQHPPGCGDDPYDPLDSSAVWPPDVAGSYTMLFTLSRADACWGGASAGGSCALSDGSIIPGSYFNCLADVQQSDTDVSVRMLCYVDDANAVVNPQLAGDSDHNGAPDTTCLPAPASQCGDGLPGASPPGATAISGPKLFADIDDRHLALAGQLNTVDSTMTIAGCWEDRDGFASLGNVLLAISLDAHTGRGEASVWNHQSAGACAAGAPAGAPTTAVVDAVRQATAAQLRDTDSDGCADARELGDDQRTGGLRDPLNSYDYPDMPTSGVRNRKIRVDDVTYVVNRYRHDLGGTVPPLYDASADRAVLRGGSAWNLGPGDGRILVTDVVAVVNSYRHDCV